MSQQKSLRNQLVIPERGFVSVLYCLDILCDFCSVDMKRADIAFQIEAINVSCDFRYRNAMFSVVKNV